LRHPDKRTRPIHPRSDPSNAGTKHLDRPQDGGTEHLVTETSQGIVAAIESNGVFNEARSSRAGAPPFRRGGRIINRSETVLQRSCKDLDVRSKQEVVDFETPESVFAYVSRNRSPLV
jgi:hypothetical protein